MDHFIQHAAITICICSLLWNVAYSFDFEDSRKDFEEARKNFERTWKDNEDRHRREFESFDRSFATVRVVVPVLMGLLFVVSCIVICCICHRRRQRFWAMQQQQLGHVPPPLAAVQGPGPVTSGATNYDYSGVNPLFHRGVATPAPAHYLPQPVEAYPWGGPYGSTASAPLMQPVNTTATLLPVAPPAPPPPYGSETKQPLWNH